MSVAEIRAALAKAQTNEEREALLNQLEQAIRAGGDNAPTEIDQVRTQVTTLTERRSTLEGEYEQVTVGAVDDAGDARAFTPEEAETRGRLSAQLEQVRAEITQREDSLRQMVETEREERATNQLNQLRRDLGLGEAPANSVGGSVQVLSEPRTYQKGDGRSYLMDVALAKSPLGMSLGVRAAQAAERLAQHARENHVHALEAEGKTSRSAHEAYFLSQMVEVHNERTQDRGPIAQRAMSYRALSTASTAGGEFVPPMYLTEQWIKYQRAGRVLADNQHHEDLPDGTMSINIPKVTAGTTVGTQGVQNTNISMTDLQTAFVTFPVVTKAGGQIVSLQLLERSPISFDQVVGNDLALAHAQNIDVAVANGPGTVGGIPDVTGILNTSGINTVTWTQASPTIKGLYGQIGLAKLDVAQTLFLPATHGVVTPNLWEWVGQSFDSQSRPLVVPEYNGPFNAVQIAPDDATAEGLVGGRLQGLNVFEDYNLPNNLGGGTNQDVMLVGRFQENYLYESPVVTRMLPQTYGTQLSMLIQLYNYVAYTAARYPIANSVITGTGMASSNRTFNS